MGTELNNVLDDIEILKEHLEYFAVCKGVKTSGMEADIDMIIAQVKNLAKRIDTNN
jgi:hypothetical protein